MRDLVLAYSHRHAGVKAKQLCLRVGNLRFFDVKRVVCKSRYIELKITDVCCHIELHSHYYRLAHIAFPVGQFHFEIQLVGCSRL